MDSDTCFEVKWSGGEGTVNMNKIVVRHRISFKTRKCLQFESFKLLAPLYISEL